MLAHADDFGIFLGPPQTHVFSTNTLISASYGAPKPACATMPSSSPYPKKLDRLMPLVRSKIWSGTTKSFGRTSSLSEPTAVKATMKRTPMDLSAAILAKFGTLDGAML